MPPTVLALRRHRTRQRAERLAAGSVYREYDLVFAMPDGRAVLEQLPLRRLRRALSAIGLPGVLRLHDLRHTAAALMLQAGVNPRVVAARLGHSNVAMTLNRYAHVTPSVEADVVTKRTLLMERPRPIVTGLLQNTADLWSVTRDRPGAIRLSS